MMKRGHLRSIVIIERELSFGRMALLAAYCTECSSTGVYGTNWHEHRRAWLCY